MMKRIYNTQEEKNKVLVEHYNRVLKEIKSDLSDIYEKMDNVSLSEAYKYDRYNKFMVQIDKRLTELAKNEVKVDKSILTESYREAYKEVSKNLGISFSKLPIETIEKAILYPWAGSNFSDTVWKNINNLDYAVKRTITGGLVKGQGYKDMARELNKLIGANGKGGYTYEALRLIRTETSHIVNQAALERYEKTNIKNVQYLAAEDERMCDICGSMHLNIYPINEAPDIPGSTHPQCRCCWAPVVNLD